MDLKYKLKKIGDNFWLVHGVIFIACSNKEMVFGDLKYHLDLSKIKELLSKFDNQIKSFTIQDMEKCFNYAKTPLMFSSFDEYKQFLNLDNDRKQEWEVEVETEFIPVNHASGLQLTGHPLMDNTILENYRPKITDGYINILKIIS